MQKILERRQKLLNVLCKRRYDKVDNLAAEFSVGERTIRRDVENLSLFYPIYTVSGKGGGIYVVDGFRQDKNYLTDKQYELLKRLSKTLTKEDFETMQSILNTYQKPKQKTNKRGRIKC